MYRFVKMHKWVGIEIKNIENLKKDFESIKSFIDQGRLVVLCDDIETFQNEFGINDIIII